MLANTISNKKALKTPTSHGLPRYPSPLISHQPSPYSSPEGPRRRHWD